MIGGAKLVLTRLWQCLLMSALLASVCFALVNTLPGDAAMRLAAARYGLDNISLDLAQAIRIEEGLDTPLIERYARWITRAATGDFGSSLITRRPVADIIAERGRNTLVLGALGWLLSYLVAIPLGTYCGLNPGKRLDRLIHFACAGLASLPTFILGTVLIGVFSLGLRWLPPAGWGEPRHFVLPALSLALGLAGYAIPMIRNTVMNVGGAFYITFARIKGLRPAQVFVRHGLRNGAIPIVTFAALQFAFIVEGFIVIETLFNYPGLGKAMLDAVVNRDIPTVMGIAILANLTFTGLNLAADLATLALSPRLADEARS
jgi:peptide/nickel transport system permease protein